MCNKYISVNEKLEKCLKLIFKLSFVDEEMRAVNSIIRNSRKKQSIFPFLLFYFSLHRQFSGKFCLTDNISCSLTGTCAMRARDRIFVRNSSLRQILRIICYSRLSHTRNIVIKPNNMERIFLFGMTHNVHALGKKLCL